MPHFHTLPDGTETSTEIVDPNNQGVHWHTVNTEETSIDPFGEEHTHTINGETTSGPIEKSSDDDNKDDKGKDHMNMETKTVGGNVVQVNQVERNGIPVGIVKGHIATFDVDRGFDRFVPGAFIESLKRHQTDNRQIRLKDHHGRTVGGFPIHLVVEDEKGLYGVGEINLEVQQGREAFALAKQGVLSDFSIGFTSIEDQIVNGIRVIHKAEVWEGSIVDEPMNPEARITEVKSVIPFQDLALASQDTEWDSVKSLIHLKELVDDSGELHPKFKKAFLWCDGKHADCEDSYKLPVADIVDGRLVVVPKGVFAATKAIQDGTIDIPESDRPEVIKNIEKYYAKMGLESPFGDNKQYFVSSDVKAWTERDVEKFLKSTNMMSRGAAKALTERFGKKEVPTAEQNEQKAREELLNEIKLLTKAISGK